MIEQINDNTYKIKDGCYLKGDRIIYPIKKDITKPFTKDNVHWKNFLIGGSWKKFFVYMWIVVMALLLMWTYSIDTKECRELMENPMQICSKISSSLLNNSIGTFGGVAISNESNLSRTLRSLEKESTNAYKEV